MKQRQRSLVCVAPEHRTVTSGWKLEGGRFQFMITINFVVTRISQLWGCTVSCTENVQRAGWPPWGHCGDNACIEMRKYARHFESWTRSEFHEFCDWFIFSSHFSAMFFFFLMFCPQRKHCSIPIAINEGFEKSCSEIGNVAQIAFMVIYCKLYRQNMWYDKISLTQGCQRN